MGDRNDANEWLEAWDELAEQDGATDTPPPAGDVDESDADWAEIERLAEQATAALREREERRRAALPAAGVVERSQRLSAVGFVPDRASRKEKRELRRQSSKQLSEFAQVRREEKARRRRARRLEAKQSEYLPAHGLHGKHQLRPLRRFRQKALRTTSDRAAFAYPFLADSGLGGEGTLMGVDVWTGTAFAFDVWSLYRRGELTNPNVLLAGVIGSGKSSCAKTLATRQIEFGRKAFIPGDPKGEWTAVAKAVGGKTISLGHGSLERLNLLDEGPRPKLAIEGDGRTVPMDDDRWRETVSARREAVLYAVIAQMLGRGLEPTERNAVATALYDVEREQRVPLIGHVAELMEQPRAAGPGATIEQLQTEGRNCMLTLRELTRGSFKGLFDQESTVTFDNSVPMLSVDLHRLGKKTPASSVALIAVGAWMEAALSDPEGGRRNLIYDEGWSEMQNHVSLARMQDHWKLARFYGISNWLVIHRLSDLDAVGDANSAERQAALGLLADTSVRIMYRQEEDQMEETARRLGLTITEAATIPGLSIGQGLWKIGKRPFLIQHEPTPAELELFSTDSRMGE